MKVTVLTISDRASRGEYEDLSGAKIAEILSASFPQAELVRIIVADEKNEILAALEKSKHADFILTTGGTGISPRDVTPDVCKAFCDKELPGIAETLRAASLAETPQAMLSRGYAGMKNNTIVINFPGSVKAVTLCTHTILPIMEHACKMIQGLGH